MPNKSDMDQAFSLAKDEHSGASARMSNLGALLIRAEQVSAAVVQDLEQQLAAAITVRDAAVADRDRLLIQNSSLGDQLEEAHMLEAQLFGERREVAELLGCSSSHYEIMSAIEVLQNEVGGYATTPAPETEAPVTEAPVTLAPETEAPVTEDPVTPPPIPPGGGRFWGQPPRSTAGLTAAHTPSGGVVPLWVGRDNNPVPGSPWVTYVLRVDEDSFRFSIIKDQLAKSGAAPGTLRWRVAWETHPLDEQHVWGAENARFNKDGSITPNAPMFPAASGPISIADLRAQSAPRIADDGSEVWRIEAAADEGQNTNRGIVFWVWLLPAGVARTGGPDDPYHMHEPIAACSDRVAPFLTVRDSDSPSWRGDVENQLFDVAARRAFVDSVPTMKAWAAKAVQPGYWENTIQIQRGVGNWVSFFTVTDATTENFSVLEVGLAGVLTGSPTPASDQLIRDLVLDSPLMPPQLGINTSRTTSRWNVHGYYGAKAVYSVFQVYLLHRRRGLWTPSEEARIREGFGRFMHVTMLRHMNGYKPWKNENGYSQSMWETADDIVAAIMARALKTLPSADRHGDLDEVFAILGRGEMRSWMAVGSGLFGLLDTTLRWNGGKYFWSHLCAGWYAIAGAAFHALGEPMPSHWRQALLDALDDKLTDMPSGPWWSPLLVCYDWYKAALDAKGFTPSARIAMSLKPKFPKAPRPLSDPGGHGAGGAALGLFWAG